MWKQQMLFGRRFLSSHYNLALSALLGGVLWTLSAVAAQFTILSSQGQAVVVPDDPAIVRAAEIARPQIAGLASRVVQPSPQIDDTLIYSFFPDTTYTTTVVRVQAGYGGATVVEGRCQVDSTTRVQSVLTAAGIRHEVHDFGRGLLYQATTVLDGDVRVWELDDTLRPPKWDLPAGEPVNAEITPTVQTQNEATPMRAQQSGAVVDMMLVFDTGAQTWAQANGGIVAVANAAVAKMNAALANSGIASEIRLVYIWSSDYTTTGSFYVDLNNLGDSKNLLVNTASLRNQYGADIVSLLIDTGSAYGITGYGYELTNLAGNSTAAFSVCAIRSVAISHTLTHEVGHNFACGHSKLQRDDPGPSSIFPYAAGWYFTGNNNQRYCTLMSYNYDGYGNSYAEIDYFSTPLVTYRGVPVGDAVDGDNARAFSTMATTVANYRTAVLPTVATPDFVPGAGTTFSNTLTVTITCDTAGATIRYTTDGSNPMPTSPVYGAPLLIATTTTVKARGFKDGMAASAVAIATFSYVPPPVVMAVTFDGGDAAVNPASKLVVFGDTYGALPVPQLEGFGFVGWYNNAAFTGVPIVATTQVDKVIDHTLYAKWEAWEGGAWLCPPFADEPLQSVGSYDGFFYGQQQFATGVVNTVLGVLALKVSNIAGQLTAKATLAGGSVSFKTKVWDATSVDGTQRATLAARTGETMELYVRQTRVWGTLEGGRAGTEALRFDGGRNRFADRADSAAAAILASFRGLYTVALPVYESLSADAEVAAAPDGAGYLSINVGTRGSVKIAGLLADGTRVSHSSRLILYEGCGDLAAVPLFAPLYARRGSLGGLLWMAPHGTIAGDTADDWHPYWLKPGRGADGFEVLLDVCGGYYEFAAIGDSDLFFSALTPQPYWLGEAALLPVAVPTTIPVTVAGTRLVMARSPRPKRVVVDGVAGYLYDDLNPANATLSFATRTGIFKGTFSLYYDTEVDGRMQHKATRVTYGGICVPQRDAAFAHLPLGLGYALVPENAPAWRLLRLKRSYLSELTR